MNWPNLIVLVLRAACLGGAAYAASLGQSELAAALGAVAGGITVAGGYRAAP